MKRIADKNISEKEFSVGDLVYIKIHQATQPYTQEEFQVES